jgi:hypothetical protein
MVYIADPKNKREKAHVWPLKMEHDQT